MEVRGREQTSVRSMGPGVPATQGLLLPKTPFFCLSSLFLCPAWLKIRCTYLMAEPSQGPLSQGRMDLRRPVGILGDWEIFLGCLKVHFQIQSQFSKKYIKIVIAAFVFEHLLCARHSKILIIK